MAVTKTLVKFMSHGEEFDTEEEAKLHDEFVTNAEGLRHAQNRFQSSLAKCQKTADGHQFKFDLWTNYYFITPGMGRPPVLIKTEFWGNNWTVSGYTDTVNIRHTEGADKEREYSINELYLDHHQAEIALLAAQEAWLKAHQEAIQELREKLKK